MKVDKDWKAALNTNGTFFDICYSYVRHNPKKGERVVPVVVISAADWEIEQARVAALEADAARMDWIQKNLLCADWEYPQGEKKTQPVICISWPASVGISGNLRSSIDDAMKGGA